MTTLVWRRSDSRLRFLGLALLVAALTAAGAHVQIPLLFTPVPLTLQTFSVLMSGALVGPAAAAAGMLIYLSAGFLGLPMFASGALLPQLGYLVAFPLAAAFVGFALRYTRSFIGALAVLSLASLFILTLGTVWLGYMLQTDRAMALGFIPFLPGDALKTIGAALTLRRLYR